MTNNPEHQESIGIVPGVFALPTPESMDSDKRPSQIEGAEKALWDESDDTAQDFPMIVWLRGDEPWFSQFDMDADAVMSALGIKRSRLTQISGKELRVGRVRMDRYIRPVFRSMDVEQYLRWTRATASHQKSSDAIKIAVDQLQQQTENIQNTLHSLTSTFTNELKSEMSTFIGECVANGLLPIVDSFNHLSTFQSEYTARLEATVEFSTKALQQATEALSGSINEAARQQSAALEILTLELNQISEKTALMEERMSAWDQMLSANLKTIAADVASMKKSKPFQKSTARKLKLTSKDTLATPSKPKLALRAAPSRRKSQQF